MSDFSLHEISVQMLNLYVSNFDKAVIGDRGAYVTTENIHITSALLEKHLNHDYSVSVFANEKSSRFVCFDIDTEDTDDVYVLIGALANHGFPEDKIYVSSSGCKGCHVEMFFDDLVSTKLLMRVYNYICAVCDFDPKKIEFRPAYTQAIKLPLGAHPRTENICWYLDTENGLKPITSRDYVMSIKQIPRDEFDKILFENIPEVRAWSEVAPVPSLKKSQKTEGLAAIKGDQYPMLTAKHTRHATMMSIAIYERKKGTPAAAIKDILCKWADEQNPDFMETKGREVYNDAANIANWVWSEDFKVPHEVAGVCRADFETVVAQTLSTDKRIAYLFLCATKKWGKGQYSLDRLAKVVGCGRSTANQSLNRLVNAGVLAKKRGNRIFELNTKSFAYEPNIYTFISHAPQEGDEIIDVDLSAAQAPDSSTYNELYLRAVAANVGEERWRELFTKKERDALYDYV